MFKWRRSNNKMSYEPKTPKLTSVSLPDEQYVPKFDTRVPRPDAVSGRSRARTMSTPGGDVHAPRPIRPHPSQGGFLPVMESGDRTRRDHSRGPRVPVGVPSAAFLEEQIRRSQQEIAPSSRSHTPTDKMHLSPVEFVDNSDPKRSRDATKRYGTKVSSHPSKAYLDDLNEQARRDHQPRHALVPSLKKTSSRSREPSDKELVDFDNWKAVPLDTDRYEPKHADRNAPLKPALKKSSADKPILKPILKSIMKKTDLMTDHKSKSYHSEAKGYHSESETRAKHEDRKPIRVAEVPSKAFLEEQKEKLEQIKQRGWASRQPPQARPELRPAPFGHSSSSTTPSPTENILYDHHGRPLVRARRQSFTDHSTPISSSYMPAYIKQEGPMMTPRAIHHPMIDIPAGHGVLSWPLVEYSLRKRDPYPLVTFDAGFNPRDLRTPVKARRTYHSTALTREEMDIPVVYGMMVTEMIIVNKKLNLWPIHIKKHSNWNTLRVIDVFRAIYDTYSQPLTPQELRHFGEDYIRRCQPAFAQRCQDSPEFNHIEERRGLLRIDMLRGRRLFKGLVPVPGRPYHWELFFDDGR